LLIDYLCTSAGRPLLYSGRDMLTSHKGMAITESDGQTLIGHLTASLAELQVPQQDDVLGFIDSTKANNVET